jgi:hypothetical protein
LFLLRVLPLKVIKHMCPRVQTKLTHIISAGGNTAVPLPVKPVCEKLLSNLNLMILCG